MAKAQHGLCVQETKEPHLPQTDRIHNLIEELLTHHLMDRKIQLHPPIVVTLTFINLPPATS